MSVSIKIDESLYLSAKKKGKTEYRSAPRQIEYWAKVGKAALDNPDLPVDFIRDALAGKDTDQSELEPFGVNK